MSKVTYPDQTVEEYRYNALGEVVWKKDRSDVTHDYRRDALGRVTSDRAGQLSLAAVDEAIQELTTEYDALGRATLLSSRGPGDSEGGAWDVVNQVKREYNGFGQLVAERQEASGEVGSGTPTVAYYYAFSQTGNYSRLDHVTYPVSGQVSYGYSGLDESISRISSVSSGSTQLESYGYA